VPPRSDENRIDCPSGVNEASVSMPGDVRRRVTPEPSALIMKSCDPPSFDSVITRRRPSGDHAGALLLPRKFASTCRAPVASDCT
jgi:hypothetical protein